MSLLSHFFYLPIYTDLPVMVMRHCLLLKFFFVVALFARILKALRSNALNRV